APQNTAGTLDTTFNSTGKIVIPISQTINGTSPPHDIAYGVAIQADQKIVMAGFAADGFTGPPAPDQVALVRLTSSGVLDTTFNGTGVVLTQLSSSTLQPGSRAQAVAIQPDGRIVVAGFSEVDLPLPHTDFALARYNGNGTLDSSFGTGGKVTSVFGGF